VNEESGGRGSPSFSGEQARNARGRKAAEVMRRKAWLIALIGALLGQAAILAATGDLIGNLVSLPILFLVVFVTVRWSARFVADSFFPVQGDGDLSQPPDGKSEVEASDVFASALRERSRAFLWGVIVAGAYGLGTTVFWIAGLRGHAQLDVLTWVLLGLAALGTALAVIAVGPRAVTRRFDATARSRPEAVPVTVRPLSWLGVMRALLPLPFGSILFLATSQLWRLVPFALMTLASGVLVWWRVGQTVTSLQQRLGPDP
jgi:hypothetical protein